MITALLLSVLFQASPAPATLAADLDGDGSPESITATPRGRKIGIEVQGSSGKRLARAEAPAPAGSAQISLTSGSLGSAGALLEVSAASAAGECRTIWRLRGRELSPVPLIGGEGRLADCSPREGWTDRWQKPREDSPSDYVRERTRSTPQGTHHRTEVYRFAGFELQLDPESSTAEIGGIPIPNWTPLVLYPKLQLDSFNSGFDFSTFKKATRLRIVTNRAEGVFALVAERQTGEQRFAVAAAAPGQEKEQWILTVGPTAAPGHARVQISLDHKSPLEVRVDGLGADLNLLYVPFSRATASGVELYPTAEDGLALLSLVGFWDSKSGRRIQVTSVSRSPAVIDFDRERVTLSISQAPGGSDVLLLPRDGSSPKAALLLRGAGVFARLPISCEPGKSSSSEACRITGPGEIFRRLGSQLNIP